MSPEYLAGILDGEGHVRFAQSNYRYGYVRLCVVNTHKPLLDAIQANFGGKVQIHTKAGHPKGWSQSWRWNTAGANAENILRLVLPFLIVKRADALAALDEATRAKVAA